MVSTLGRGAQSRSPSVLLVRLDAVGDALTLVPAIAALRAHDLRIGAVLRPVNAQIFSRRALDFVHVANGEADALVPEIRAQHYGAALIATEKPQAYRLAQRARIPQRIGFENGWGKPLKTLWIRRACTRTVFRTAGLDPRAPHECEVIFTLVRQIVDAFEPSRDPRVLRPFVIDEEPPPDERIAFQVTDKWLRLGATLDAVVEAARRIAERREVRFISSSREAEFADAFARAACVRIDAFDEAAPWKNAIAGARALVAPDSGAVHVAGMIGTPVVACFSPDSFALQSRRWSPWAAPHRIVSMQQQWPLVAQDALEDLLSEGSRFSYTG